MPFHRHHHRRGTREFLTLGITSGNVARLRKGPIEFQVDGDKHALRCVLRLDHHPLPHPARFAVTLNAGDLRSLLDEGLIEFVGTTFNVVCVFGRTPALAGAALRRAVGVANA